VGCKLNMGNSQSKLTVDLCVNVLVRPTRISPRQSGAAKAVKHPSGGCKARPDRWLRTAICKQRRPGRVPAPWFYKSVSSSPHTDYALGYLVITLPQPLALVSTQ
jgi:hypothetical protein